MSTIFKRVTPPPVAGPPAPPMEFEVEVCINPQHPKRGFTYNLRTYLPGDRVKVNLGALMMGLDAGVLKMIGSTPPTIEQVREIHKRVNKIED